MPPESENVAVCALLGSASETLPCLALWPILGGAGTFFLKDRFANVDFLRESTADSILAVAPPEDFWAIRCFVGIPSAALLDWISSNLILG